MIMTRSVTIELTPQLTAHAFCEMDAQQQAEFFNEVAHISNRWGWFIAVALLRIATP